MKVRLIIAACLLFSGLYLLMPVQILSVIDPVSGRILMAFPVSPGDRMQISYTHSLYKVLQIEKYYIDESFRMILDEMDFGSFDAAMYYNENQPNLFFEDGYWKSTNINQLIEVVNFRVGINTNCILFFNNFKIPFSSIAEKGSLVQLSIKNIRKLNVMGVKKW